MRPRDFRPFRYQLTRVPTALRRARLDNIAIVPASMLESQGTLKKQIDKLTHGEVLLCHTPENTRQRRVLERVKEVFQHFGYAVTLLPMEQLT
jgi:hypothetical protein